MNDTKSDIAKAASSHNTHKRVNSFQEIDENENKRKIIADILGIDNDGSWSIIDQDDDIHMVHYKVSTGTSAYNPLLGKVIYPPNYPDLRGVGVDIKNKQKVIKSFPYTPTCIADALVPKDGKLMLEDVSGYTHQLDPSRCTYYHGFEGTVLRVSWINRNLYVTTHKRLDTSKSHFGPSPNFLDIYKNFGGPTEDELFDTTMDYSPYCFIFMIVHPDLVRVSKLDVGGGFLVHLATKMMWSMEDSPYDSCEESAKKVPRLTSDLEEIINAVKADNNSKGLIFEPPYTSIDDANKHLKYGFYMPGKEIQDPRLSLGEMVIVRHMLPDGTITMYNVISTSHAWRCSIRGHDSNLYRQFYLLLEDITMPLAAFKAKYPSFYYMDKEELVKYRLVMPIIDNDDLYVTPRGRKYLIWVALFIASPLGRQRGVIRKVGRTARYDTREDEGPTKPDHYTDPGVIDFMDLYTFDREDMYKWFTEINMTDSISEEYSDNIASIIYAARNTAITHKKEDRESIMNRAIKQLLNKRPTKMLYRIRKEIKSIRMDFEDKYKKAVSSSLAPPPVDVKSDGLSHEWVDVVVGVDAI